MAQLAERIHVDKQSAGPIVRKARTNVGQSSRSSTLSNTHGSLGIRVASPVSHVVASKNQYEMRPRLAAHDGNHSNLGGVKLPVTAHSEDDCEREADRISEEALRVPAPVDRVLVAEPAKRSTSTPANLPASMNHVLRSPGRALDSSVREYFEPRFGHDFSQVRVHADLAAQESARDVRARAFTVGRHIAFAAGRYAPDTREGRRLIGHELTHVVQQLGAEPRLARSPSDKEAAAIGSGIEPLELKEWKKSLEAKGYEVFSRTQFDRVEWLAKAFSDRRARPDVVAVNRSKRHVLVGDITAGPWSQAALKPGDVRKLPRDIGAEPETKHHLEKTVENARQAHKHLPEDLRGFSVSAQDRWWKEGKLSREVFVAKGRPPPKAGGMPSSGSSSGMAVVKKTAPSPSTAPIAAKSPASSIPAKGAQPTTARTGTPLQPVVEATPGFKPAKGAAIGGAIQVLQAMQFASLQRSEVEKFQKRSVALQPKIDAFLEAGYSVQLILIVEKPDRPDVFCAAGVFCDSSQIIYFRDLFISRVEDVRPKLKPVQLPPTSHPSISAPGGRDSFIPYTSQGGSIIEEKEIRFLSADHSDYHCEYGKHTMYPSAIQLEKFAVKANEQNLTTPEHVRNIAGSYMTEFLAMYAGSIYDLFQLHTLKRGRLLKVELTTAGRAIPNMTFFGRAYAFEDGGPRPPRQVMSGWFKMGEGKPPAASWIWSSMEYYPERSIILESAQGYDADLKKTWGAYFRWRRL